MRILEHFGLRYAFIKGMLDIELKLIKPAGVASEVLLDLAGSVRSRLITEASIFRRSVIIEIKSKVRNKVVTL